MIGLRPPTSSKAGSAGELQTVLYPVLIRLREGDIEIPEEEVIRTLEGEHLLFRSVNVIDSVHRSWLPLLMDRGFGINERLKKIYRTGYENGFTIRPNAEDVFNAFSTPLDRVRAVVVGQDPYPGWDREMKRPVANGYAFATMVSEIPASLQRMRVAIATLFGSIQISDKKHPNSLRGWINQGVLLLNNTPIVFISQEHGNIDSERTPRMRALLEFPFNVWQNITVAICREIGSISSQCPFLLLGSRAHYLRRSVARSVCAGHPSTRAEAEFDGQCFTEIPEIDWTLM